MCGLHVEALHRQRWTSQHLVDEKTHVVAQELGRYARLQSQQGMRSRSLDGELIREHRENRLNERSLATMKATQTRRRFRGGPLARTLPEPQTPAVATKEMRQPWATVTVVRQGVRPRRSREQVLGHGPFTDIRRTQYEIDDRTPLGDQQMQAKAEKMPFLRWDIAIRSLGDRCLTALGAHKMHGFDRCRIDHKPEGEPLEGGHQLAQQVKLHAEQGFAPAMVAAAFYQIREEMQVVLGDDAVKAQFRVVREGFLHQRERDDLAIGEVDAVVSDSVAHRIGYGALVEIINETENDEKHLVGRQGVVHGSRALAGLEYVIATHSTRAASPAVSFGR